MFLRVCHMHGTNSVLQKFHLVDSEGGNWVFSGNWTEMRQIAEDRIKAGELLENCYHVPHTGSRLPTRKAVWGHLRQYGFQTLLKPQQLDLPAKATPLLYEAQWGIPPVLEHSYVEDHGVLLRGEVYSNFTSDSQTIVRFVTNHGNRWRAVMPSRTELPTDVWHIPRALETAGCISLQYLGCPTPQEMTLIWGPQVHADYWKQAFPPCTPANFRRRRTLG